jgi:ElaB/YqjD/DUF883 family membrane-anchored ribosome-binding protein
MKSNTSNNGGITALRQSDAVGHDADIVERNKEKMLADLKVLVADAEVLIRDAARTSTEGFAALCENLEAKLNGAKAEVRRAKVTLTATTRQAANATQEFARGNPWKLAAFSVAAGLLCGLLLTPRRVPLDSDASR